MIPKEDLSIIRELATQVAEIAALPVQDEKRKLWRKLNAKKPERPMVMIDQVCWNEIDDDSLRLRCTDADCRDYEQYLRQTLYQWHHFPVDMVVENFIEVHKAFENTRFGVDRVEDTVASDPTNGVVGHFFHNQFERDEDIEKIKMPCVTPLLEETARRVAVAHELFDGILEQRVMGPDVYVGMWDPISTWFGVQNALYALIERPEFMHRLVARVTEGYLSMLDQLEEHALLPQPQPLIHCTGAYTDELPAPGYNPEKPRTKDIWMFGLAQMFSTCSPDMFREFEVDYTKRICERFGMVYYGCCDPLDGKMNEVRMLPNVRKVSMSTWANQERGAEEINGDFVFSRKPNPAYLAFETFDADIIRQDLTQTRDICAKYNCPLEIIQKDLSTIRREPQRLDQWAKIAMEIVGA